MKGKGITYYFANEAKPSKTTIGKALLKTCRKICMSLWNTKQKIQVNKYTKYSNINKSNGLSNAF